MKRIIAILAVAALAVTSAFAQDFSVGAGYLNSVSTAKYAETVNKTVSNGFYAGVGAETAINGFASVSTGVYYSFITFYSTASAVIANAQSRTNEHYVNVPVHLNLGYELSGGMRLFAYAGPTLNVGLISKTKADASVALVTITKTEYDNYAEGSEYGRFDVMIGGGAGIQFQNMKVYGGYNYGLLDRNSGATNLHRSEIVAGVAFNF